MFLLLSHFRGSVPKHYTMFLATQGFQVINFNYRLAPENPYPAALEDINQLMNWVIENKEVYHLDSDHLFLIGDSAGAQLTEQYAAILTNQKYASLFAFDVPRMSVKAMALNCGLYFVGKNEPINKAFPFYFQKEDSFIQHFPVESFITDKFPPCYVMTCSHDFLKDLALPLAVLLEEKHVPVVYKEYKMADLSELHHVFHINQKSDIARDCNKSELSFFETYIN